MSLSHRRTLRASHTQICFATWSMSRKSWDTSDLIVGVDGIRETIDALQIQMVRGLVEQQHIGLLHADHGVDQAALLTLAEFTDESGLHHQEAAAAKYQPLVKSRLNVIVLG